MKSKYITEVSVLDPDSMATIQVAIYKDLTSGAMFGLDSSFIEQVDPDTIPSPFNKDGTLHLPSDSDLDFYLIKKSLK